MDMKKKILMVFLVFAIGYTLNFVWESYHSVFFYTCCGEMSAPEHLKLISYVSFVDASLITGIFLVIGLFRGFLWFKKKGKRDYIVFSVIAFFIALLIEYRGVYLLGKWSYNSNMPLLFGFGLSPLIQLIITGIISIVVSDKLAHSF